MSKDEGTGATPAVSVLVVDPRIIRRVIKRDRNLWGVGVHVPHDQCYAVGRDALRSTCTDSELGSRSKTLDPTVVLVARPEDGEADGALLIWRRTFHGLVHAHLDQRAFDEATLRERINRVGQTEFDEVRQVLTQDELLIGSADDREAYFEFAASYLELRYFAPQLLERTFPAIADHAAILASLSRDVDAAPLLAQARPADAPPLPDPSGVSEALESGKGDATISPASASEAASLQERAAAARAKGNLVRAAVDELRIATAESRARAEADLLALARRLIAALEPPEGAPRPSSFGHHEGGEPQAEARELPDAAGWVGPLRLLASVAASRQDEVLGVEARCLFDLQDACLDFERERRTIDVVGAALSFGRRKIVRPLPAARSVRVVRHLRNAREKAGHARVSPADRHRVEGLLELAEEQAEHKVRASLGPRIRAVLEQMGLVPRNTPERVAMSKLVEELLDQIVERGFLGIGHLRDSVSRSNLKLPNLSGVGQFWRGDALLLADERLAEELDGVYRRGEIYLRGLQKLSSVAFGTTSGRFLTRHLILPGLLAFVTLEGLQHLLAIPAHLIFHYHEHIHLLHPVSWVLLATFVYLLIHSAGFRGGVGAVLSGVGRGFRAVLVDAPRWLLTRPVVVAVWKSKPFVLARQFFFKPGLLAGLIYLVAHRLHLPVEINGPASGVAFLGFLVLLNTGLGQAIEESVIDWVTLRWHFVQRRVLPGLVQWISAFFRQMLEGLDRVIYAVDEWLRFKEGEPAGALWAKGALGVVWFFLTYALRIGVNAFIEPQINPIKHFPVVTVSHKLLLSVDHAILHGITSSLSPLIGVAAAGTMAGTTVLLLPGIFGFLVWELKGNWGLYQQNRHELIEPVLVGHHGETLDGLLKPGFHSGTVPKLHARLRHALRKGNSAAKHREGLREVEVAVRNFVEREFVSLLRESEGWTARDLHVARVELGSNRIRIRLACPSLGAEEAWIHFEEQSGWIVAQVARPGWLASLSGDNRSRVEAAVAGLYKMANVDIAREQIEARLDGSPPYDIADEGLVVWPDADYRSEVVYALNSPGLVTPSLRGQPLASAPPALDSQSLLFTRQPILWTAWIALWGHPDAAAAALSQLRAVSLLPGRPT
jgi:hypothetical protein